MPEKVKKATFTYVLFLIICILQLSGLKGIGNYTSIVLLLVCSLLMFCECNGKIHKITAWIILFLVYYSITSLPNLNTKYFATYLANNMLSFFPAVYYNYYLHNEKSDRQKVKRKLIPLLFIWFLMVYLSIYFYILNPSAARVLARDGDAYQGSIIGGYPLAYGSALLCVALLGCQVKYRFRGTIKLILMIQCISLLILIYLTESTLTTFATIIGLIVTFFANPKIENKTNRIVYYFIVLFFAVLLFYFTYIYIEENINGILLWLQSRSDYLIYRRISEIFNSIFLDVETRHYEERHSLITNSLNLFIHSPIIGHGYKYGNVFSAGKVYGIGNHSEFFDSLARYGLVGFLPLFIIYFNNAKKIFTRNIGVLVTFLIMILCNPFISFSANLSFFLIIRLIYELCDEYEKNIDEKTYSY